MRLRCHCKCAHAVSFKWCLFLRALSVLCARQSFEFHPTNRRNLNAFPNTVTLEAAIANAANIGDSNNPKAG